MKVDGCDGKITVSIADAALAKRMAAAITRAVRAVETPDLPSLRIVRFRTKKRLAQLREDELSGAIAVIRVTERNARHLEAWTRHVRQAGALGIQWVWDGSLGPLESHPRILGHVFRTMEMVRATPQEPPAVLAAQDEPVAMLYSLIRARLHNPAKGALPS